MYTPFTSKHFTRYTDPESGICMAILATRVAPIQEGMYFVNTGCTDDHRYLWFRCCFPPVAKHSLAVIDFLTDEIHHFPETDGNGLIDRKTGEAYWYQDYAIRKRSPDPAAEASVVAWVPEAWRSYSKVNGPRHLTFTPDKTELIGDFYTSEGTIIGSFDLQSGAFTQWYRTEPGVCFDHAQCSPIDKDLLMCAREMWNNQKNCLEPVYEDGIFPRIQFITRDGTRRIIRLAGNNGGHEWWAASGKRVYYINNNLEESGVGIVARDDLDGTEPKIIFRNTIPGAYNHTWHAQCSRDERYFVIDAMYPEMGQPVWRGNASAVYFHNTETGKSLRFLTKNPILPPWTPETPCAFDIDPHPSFIMDDSLINFTTTVLGQVDLAIAKVEDLVKATQ